ncbi:MAG: hypothetical protein MUE70_00580 [Desulfobacterales bacterium]|jgi:hypothetical protein|nr:hypothetical protein [Desulfobacterales bacterium]
MKNFGRRVTLTAILMMAVLIFFSCSKPKEGKVVVTEQEFLIRQDNPNAYVVDAKGKVRNVGEVDVKNVVVTGSCPSCIDAIIPGKWMGAGKDKTQDQKDVISFIPVGQEEEFTFRGVAFIYNTVAEEPKEKPEKMEVVIESFEVVD